MFTLVQRIFTLTISICLWLMLFSVGLRYFLSDWSGQVSKERAADKPSASAVSAVSRLSKFPALQKYCESLRSIPSGTFQMGGTQFDSEKPVHSVTLSAFRIGATPVTVAVWKEYCRAVNLKMPIAPERGWKDDHPIVNVSWEDIMGSDGNGGFCAWASRVAGFSLTLPTEAQFEYAARGGQAGLDYPWGNSFDDSKLWCSSLTARSETAPVDRKSHIFRNKFGLSDMSGNVLQWCSDLYGPYSGSAQNDPTGPSLTSNNERCVRGGPRFTAGLKRWRCAFRNKFYQDMSYPLEIGFRLSAGPG